MKNKVKRAIYMLLVAIILFSAPMAIPALHDSKYKDIMQGGAFGLTVAGLIITISIFVDYFKERKTKA